MFKSLSLQSIYICLLCQDCSGSVAQLLVCTVLLIQGGKDLGLFGM